jgi:hypothetical protein
MGAVMTGWRALVIVSTVTCLVAVTRSAAADAQGNAALTIGGAGVGQNGEFWDHPEFHMGLRGDAIFGREGGYDFGAGPYAEVGTMAFDELQFGGGVSVLFPVHDTLPLIASVGPYGRYGDDDFGLEPGLAGAIFWGSRSYNFHEGYIMSWGLSVGYRHSLGESQESMLLVAAQIDLVSLGVPFIMLVNLMRGPTDEASNIED